MKKKSFITCFILIMTIFSGSGCSNIVQTPQTVYYSVTFSEVILDGVKYYDEAVKEVAEGSVVIPPDFSVEGYTLDGWYKSKTEQNQETLFDLNTKIYGDTVLYAKYTLNDEEGQEDKTDEDDKDNEDEDGDEGITDEFTIITAEELKNIDLNGNYTLGANLTLTDWIPLGSPQLPFTGTLDGNGFGITYFSMDFSSLQADFNDCYYGGLFAVNEGVIKDITVTKAVISGSNLDSEGARDKYYIGVFAGQNYGLIENCGVEEGEIDIEAADFENFKAKLRAGLIAGWNAGNIEGCFVSGEIRTSTESSTNRAGGICGTNEGGSVMGCGAYVNVDTFSKSGSISAGGLIGYLEGGGTVEKSSAEGNVSAESVETGTVYAGGLTGYTDAVTDKWNYKFENCYALVNVFAKSLKNAYAGGLIARIENNKTAFTLEVYIENCYAAGNVKAEGSASTDDNVYAAGLVGRIQITEGSVISIQNSFAAGSVESTQNAGNVRSGGDGTWNNNYYAESQSVVSGNGKINAKGATAVSETDLLSEDWQQENLGWSGDIWEFNDNSFPTLK